MNEKSIDGIFKHDNAESTAARKRLLRLIRQGRQTARYRRRKRHHMSTMIRWIDRTHRLGTKIMLEQIR